MYDKEYVYTHMHAKTIYSLISILCNLLRYRVFCIAITLLFITYFKRQCHSRKTYENSIV